MPTKIVIAITADDMKLRRYGRAFLLWLSAVATQATLAGPDAMMAWTPKRWALAFLCAGIAGSAGLINLGEMNPKEKPADAKE